MIHLYLARHGQTIWNVQHRRQGRSDSPLTETGIAQARSLGKALENTVFDLILSSPSKRAMDTAKIIIDVHSCADQSATTVQIIEDEKLYEMGFGIWEGKTPEEMKAIQDENEEHFWKCPSKYQKPEGGESFTSLIERTGRFIQEITDGRYDGKHILAVSHTATIKAILMQLQKLELNQFWGENFIHAASLTQIRFYTREDYEIIKIGEVFYPL